MYEHGDELICLRLIFEIILIDILIVDREPPACIDPFNTVSSVDSECSMVEKAGLPILPVRGIAVWVNRFIRPEAIEKEVLRYFTERQKT
jgi:hypothetical protein